jgi:hypothetical protein
MTFHQRTWLLYGVAAAALIAGVAAAQTPSPETAPAQAGTVYDLSQLPKVSSTVTRYTLTPRGDVDGLILADGTEVHVPPHLSTQLVFVAKPGDSVTVRGLKALNENMINALSVTNDATGQQVVDNGPPPGGRGPGRLPGMQAMDAQGAVQTVLHGPRGEVNGAVLADGTILRLPPPEATRFADLLRPGATLAAKGDGTQNALGRVIAVRQIGPSATQLSEIAPPPPPHGRHRFPPPPPGAEMGAPPPPPPG